MSKTTQTFELYIHHGRKSPDEDLDHWGADGPRLRNCTGIHCTYQNTYVFFATQLDRDIAAIRTGWETWEETSLVMKYHDDLLVAKFENGITGYFGDWGLIAPST